MEAQMAHTHPYEAAEPRSSLGATLSRYAPMALALLRIGAGLLFMQHGGQKLFGWFGGFGAPGATAELMSQMGLAGILEFFGGLLIVLGLLTRPVAFLLAGEMVVAFFQAHLPRGGSPLENGGEVPLLYALIFLALVFLGPGAASIDGAIGRGRR
jgi:putative oxidoreductase